MFLGSIGGRRGKRTMSIRQSPYVGIGLRLTSRLEVHEVIPGGATAACGLIEQGSTLREGQFSVQRGHASPPH
jgi:hypothetical protein